MQQNRSRWSGTAPANIALIKYMGKSAGNVPTNASLSYTTPQFYTSVWVELRGDAQDMMTETARNKLGSAACLRFLAHVQIIKAHFGFDRGFLVDSYNNFPMGCGVASSASSFAALTRVLCQAICAEQGRADPTMDEVAGLSRLGSGSSCRSFFTPWALWSESRVAAVDLPDIFAQHWVVGVSTAHKLVGSSSAHQRVRTSLLFAGRAKRADQRLQALLTAIRGRCWDEIYSLVWADFQDMHALFTTSVPAFSYVTPETIHVLGCVQDCWQTLGDGPIATLDAGPNVHLLFRDDHPSVVQYMQDAIAKTYTILREGG